MRKPIFWIFILALLLRIYKLGVFPVGLHVDEVKVGWNAASILTTGKDDQGHTLPLSYNSFGDFRPTGIFYLTIPSIILFGRSVFAIRFSSALLGALTVFPIYQLVMLLTKNKKKIWKLNAGDLSGLLLALSPWHIEVSRATSESVISVFFALYAIYFFIKLIKSKKTKYAFLSILFIIPSSLLYHSIRLIAPLFYLAVIVFYFQNIKNLKIKNLVFGCFIVSVIFSILFTLIPGSEGRLSQVSILNDPDLTYQINRVKNDNKETNIFTKLFDNKFVIYSEHIIQGYANYFGSGFLIGNAAKPYRYATPGAGLLNYIEVVFLVAGLIAIFRGEEGYLPLILLLLSPIPAALTIEDSPNLQRAIFMLPFLITIESYGFSKTAKFFSKFTKHAFKIVFIGLAINCIFFLYMYFAHSDNHFPYILNYFGDNGTYRDVGAIELVFRLEALKSKYEKIIVTNYPDSVYPWYAFFNNKNPADFNKSYNAKTNERDFENIVFSESKCPSDDDFSKYKEKEILVVDNWECPYANQINAGMPAKVVEKINRSNGTEAYILLTRD